jgi:hypothetical protein
MLLPRKAFNRVPDQTRTIRYLLKSRLPFFEMYLHFATSGWSIIVFSLYQSDQAEELCSFMFVSVLDAIQGDGFNPLWQEVQIVFPDCASVKQFNSDNDILAAATAGTITLVPTTELYRCSVVGPGPKKP